MKSRSGSAGSSKWHRVSQLAHLINGYPFESKDFTGAGVPLLRIRDLTSDEFETFVPRERVPHWAIVRDGDVVIGMDGDFNAVFWQRGEAALNQRVCVLRARPRVDPRFLAYAITAPLREINDLTWSTTVKHLSSASIRSIKIPAYSAEAQRAIADYLDRETAQIDAFIAKNEELITLLNERRAGIARSIVEERVGNGARIKFMFSESDARAGARWIDLPLLSVSIHHGVTQRSSDSERAVAKDDIDLSHYKLAHTEDIVLNRMRAFQGGLGVAPCEGIVSPDYAVIRAFSELNPHWLAVVMRTERFVAEMAMRLRGIGSTESGAVRTPRINVADLGDIRLAVPALAVQHEELDAVANGAAQIDRALVIAQEAIDLARERRAALISAAVTGRIDVGVAA